MVRGVTTSCVRRFNIAVLCSCVHEACDVMERSLGSKALREVTYNVLAIGSLNFLPKRNELGGVQLFGKAPSAVFSPSYSTK